MVRPVEYSVEIFDDICARVAEGESLNKITKEEKYPVKMTFYRWLRSVDGLSDQYGAAKMDRADTYADEIVDIADKQHTSNEDIQAAKLRIDARKWIACKLHPRNYGDKSAIEHSGEIKQPNITFTLNQ
jgi:hypothetical protein